MALAKGKNSWENFKSFMQVLRCMCEDWVISSRAKMVEHAMMHCTHTIYLFKSIKKRLECYGLLGFPLAFIIISQMYTTVIAVTGNQ